MPLQLFVCEFSCECFCVWYLVRLLLFFLLVCLHSFDFFLADFFSSFVLLRIFYFFSRACVCLFVCLCLCVCACGKCFVIFITELGLCGFRLLFIMRFFFTIDVPFIIRFFSNWMSRMNFMLWFVCVARSNWSNVKFSRKLLLCNHSPANRETSQ